MSSSLASSTIGSFNHYMYLCATQIKTNWDIALIIIEFKFQLLLEICHQVMFDNLKKKLENNINHKTRVWSTK